MSKELATKGKEEEYQCQSCYFYFKAMPDMPGIECPNCEIDATGGGAIRSDLLPDFHRDYKVKSKEHVWLEMGIDVNNEEFMAEATKKVEEMLKANGTSLDEFMQK
jgi:hypothetical protein